MTTQDEKALRQFLHDREDSVLADYEKGTLDKWLQQYSQGYASLFVYAYLTAIADIKELHINGSLEVSRLPHDYIPDPRIVQDGDPPTRDTVGFPLK